MLKPRVSPVTRVYLTIYRLYIEEPSTRCSFTVSHIYKGYTDLDPRYSISITRISNDVTLPPHTTGVGRRA